MIRVDREGLRRAETARGILLSRATGALEAVARRVTDVPLDEPDRAAAELRGAVAEGLLALAQVAEVAGFFDSRATVDVCALDEGEGD